MLSFKKKLKSNSTFDLRQSSEQSFLPFIQSLFAFKWTYQQSR